jgi:ketosteroid isomerase-like protein
MPHSLSLPVEVRSTYSNSDTRSTYRLTPCYCTSGAIGMGTFGEITNLITKLTVSAVLCAFLTLHTFAQDRPTSGMQRDSTSPTSAARNAVHEIQQLLDAQVDAWNRGDLEAFMLGYWHSPELTFFSNDSETRGWQETLDRYKKRYQAEGHTMGKLDFQTLRITPLGDDSAFARGRFHLKMPDGKEMQGMFTLVLRKFSEDGWRIVHDHSSG